MAGGVYQSNEIRSFNPVDDPFATELFGELYFKEINDSDPTSWHTLFPITSSAATRNKDQMKDDGINKESTDDSKDLEKKAVKVTSPKTVKVTSPKTVKVASPKIFPPPITSLDQKTGEPLFSLKSYRQDGRLVIKMVNNDTSCGIEPAENNNNSDSDDNNNNQNQNNNDEKKMKKERMCKCFSFAGIFKLCASFKKDKK